MTDTLKQLAERANRIAEEMEATVTDMKHGIVNVDNHTAREQAVERLEKKEAEVNAHPEYPTWRAGKGWLTK